MNGLMIDMDPTTTEMMNEVAPISSPIANEPVSALIAANVENTSGAPLPKPRRVTPARFSERPNLHEIVDRLGQKKSEATIPTKEKRKLSQRTKDRMTNARMLRVDWA